MNRSIAQVIHAPLVNMGPSQIRQPLPVAGTDQISPFLLIHHFDLQITAGHNSFDIPPHPHKGFMPVTYMYDGEIEHEDSLGNRAVIGPNEVQWINAGKGLLHAERAGDRFSEKGGRFQGIQLWINLPAEKKQEEPDYQPLTSEDIVLAEEPGMKLYLVSGNYKGEKGPAHSDVFSAMIRMEAGAGAVFSFPEHEHTLLYVLEGAVQAPGAEVKQHDLLVYGSEGTEVSFTATEASSLLLLSAEPIEEPVASYGPFVMNSQEEIMEAISDYRQGKMGTM